MQEPHERGRKNGLMDEVTESLRAAGVAYELLGGVVPNPRLSKVYEGIELGRKTGAESRMPQSVARPRRDSITPPCRQCR